MLCVVVALRVMATSLRVDPGENLFDCSLGRAAARRLTTGNHRGMRRRPDRLRGPDSAPAKNRAAYARDLGTLVFVLLTHAHLDHSGLLPRFATPHGRGPMIWCTKPTADLLPLMLKIRPGYAGRRGVTRRWARLLAAGSARW